MRVSKKDVVQYYKSQADDYQRMYANPRNMYRKRRRIDATTEFLRPWAQSGQTVLEIGSGDGYFTSRIAQDWDWCSYLGCDFSIPKLGRLTRSLKRARAVSADGEALPFASEAFDVALCFETIEHLLDPEAAMREIYRVLKPCGTLILSTSIVAQLHAFAKRQLVAAKTDNDTGGFEEHVQEFTIKDVLALAAWAGFAVRSWRTCVYEFSVFGSLFRRVPYAWYRVVDQALGHVPIGSMGISCLHVSIGAEYLLLAATKGDGRRSLSGQAIRPERC